MLKKLNAFQTFLWDEWAKSKAFVVTACGPWLEYSDGKPTGKTLGSRVELAIADDRTVYPLGNGETATGLNLYEKVSVKLPREGVDIPIRTRVEVIGGKASIYGDYRNQLSVQAEEVRPIASKGV